jgi:ketosteroid isomerase-like protein
MRRSLTLVVLFIVSASSQVRAQASVENQLTDLYRRLIQATQDHDTVALGKVLAPDYTFVPPRADTILTRAERMANTIADTNRVKFEVLGCRTTMINHDAAVGHCRYRVTAPTEHGDTVRNFLSTAVFAKRGKQWQIVATHPSASRPPEAP